MASYSPGAAAHRTARWRYAHERHYERMINRLLDRIDSPRRHLAVLMSLLSITFVLTGVLAWQAHRTEQAKDRVKQARLDEMAYTGATAFSVQFALFADAAAPYRNSQEFLRYFVRARDVTATRLSELVDMSTLCGGCADSGSGRTSFLVDLASGDVDWVGPARNPAAARVVTSFIRDGKVAQTAAELGFGYYSVADAAHPMVFAVVRHVADKPDRIFGVLIDSATVRHMLRLTLTNERIYPEGSQGLTTHSLLARRMIGAGMQVFSTGPAGTQSVARDTSTAPLFGAHFEANVRASAEKLLFPQQTTAQWPLLVLLVTLIALLFTTSMLLVRREAELAHMRADFIASASHELRTPLAQIRMFTETLLLGRVRSDTERRRSLEIVDQEARRLSNLVDNLLAFSRNEGGRTVRIAPEPTHFAEEIRRAVESFGPMARTNSVDIRPELQENVSAAVDRNALRQILVNLLDNAMKYGPTGQRVTVGLALIDDAARLWVDDEGPGIPQPDRERVFESFYRMRRDIDARITGSGIGLAVVRQLARLHAGEAWAEAAPGGGARIVVQFPGAYLRDTGAADLAAAS